MAIAAHVLPCSTKRAALRRALLTGACLIVLWMLIAWGAARWLIVGNEVDIGRAGALVVLGGSAAYVERTARAAELYAALDHDGAPPRVILTDDGGRAGWSPVEQRNPPFVELARNELIRGGVREADIETLPPGGDGTHAESVALREYAARHTLRSLLVVTSPYHTRRARWTFQRVFAGEGVTLGFAHPAPGAQSPQPSAWWLTAAGWKTVASEYPKLIYYRLRYGDMQSTPRYRLGDKSVPPAVAGG